MVQTIPTVGRDRGNSGRWVATALVYLATSTLAAALFGAVLALLGRPVAAHLGWSVLTPVVGGVALVFGLADLGMINLPRLQRNKQVPSGWRARFSPEVTAGLYGAMLGVGVLTRIPFASLYVLLIWTALSGTVPSGVAIFGAYGLTRALPATLLSTVLHRDEVAYQLTRRLLPWQRPLQRLTGVILLGFALIMLARTFG